MRLLTNLSLDPLHFPVSCHFSSKLTSVALLSISTKTEGQSQHHSNPLVNSKERLYFCCSTFREFIRESFDLCLIVSGAC